MLALKFLSYLIEVAFKLTTLEDTTLELDQGCYFLYSVKILSHLLKFLSNFELYFLPARLDIIIL